MTASAMTAAGFSVYPGATDESVLFGFPVAFAGTPTGSEHADVPRSIRPGRTVADRIYRAASTAGGLITLLLLVLIGWFLLRQGMPALRGRHRGNLRVIVNVVIPRHLKKEQKELLQQLADSLTEHNLRTDEGVLGKLKRAFGA